MRLKDCLCILNANLNLDKFKSIFNFLTKEFDQYRFDFKSPYNWLERVPNPDYKPDNVVPDDEEILEYREAAFGFKMGLKKVTHANFNIECIYYQDNIYIAPCAYYYAKFNASNLESYIKAYLEADDKLGLLLMTQTCVDAEEAFTFSKDPVYNKQTYKQWVDAHPDQKWAQHNYKIDKEDLVKIGIEV